MKGAIIRRGKASWRLKYDTGRDAKGKRQIRYVTVRGKRQDAERELAVLLTAHHQGTGIEPNKITVTDFVRSWLATAEVSPKTLERYRQLVEQQIIPHLGGHALQKLKPSHIEHWHRTLLERGGQDGAPLSARTVGHAHRVLHVALSRAARAEHVYRNVASAIHPPRVETEEIDILSATEMAAVLTKMKGSDLYPIVALALASGMRRGELLALQWADVDWAANAIKVHKSVEETKQGLRLKAPKTKNGRRTISLPYSTMEILRGQLRDQRETRVQLGLGRETSDTPVFATPEGALLTPSNLSRNWARAVKELELPCVTFHALRHSHASALIAAGLDVVQISKRLGHGSPAITLTVYSHLFDKSDCAAAVAIEAALRGGS